MKARAFATVVILLGLLVAGGAGTPVSQAMPPAGPEAANAPLIPESIIYVDADAPGANNGSSWGDAYTDLQVALGAATNGDQIWVAEGTYKPTSGTSRYIAFELKSGVALYGGFAGTETLLSQRDWQAHPTILSGDIGTTGVAGDNSYNVVRGNSTVSTAMLDGFVVTGGYANGSPDTYDKGGGLHVSNGSPTIANVTFVDNYAMNHGGGMMVQYTSTPLVVNCVFSGNSTAWNAGGLAVLWFGHPTVVNSTFSGNIGHNGGGIVNLEQGNATVRNTILWGNESPQIGLQTGASISVQYSLIEGGYTGTGNIGDDPLFVDPDGPDDTVGTLDDDLRLQDTSPAIDAADNAAVPPDSTDMDGDGNTAEVIPLDQDGTPRFVDVPTVPDTGNGSAPIVDMGAYERALILMADLAVAKTVTPPLAGPGQAITYTLVYTNHGADPASGVSLSDSVPLAVTNLSYDSSGAIITPTGGISYTWQVVDLNPGEGGVITITGVISPEVSGVFSLTNSVEITATSVDSDTTNNTSVVTSTVDAQPPGPPSLYSPADGAVISDTTPTLTWLASPSPDAAGYLLDWNGTVMDVADTNQFTTPILTPGTYTWTVAAYDGVGNTSAYTDVWTFTLEGMINVYLPLVIRNF